jgi:hypothetical protein
MFGRRRLTLIATAILAVCGLVVWRNSSSMFARDEVHFSTDIRPIFNQNYVQCHGGVRQKNGVSFIYRDEALLA